MKELGKTLAFILFIGFLCGVALLISSNDCRQKTGQGIVTCAEDILFRK